ncbi:MAG: hypothetical protein EA422_03470 [Gemmatimonadales bacterium]|nr:MAG: hypothetical protein EA422_03470 [Gemmatimonadales bacterium]
MIHPDPGATNSQTDPLAPLPDQARLWVFGTDRALDASEQDHLLEAVDDFLEAWKAHGKELAAARDWREGRFLFVGVDESVAPPTGCSIDALRRRLQEVERELGIEMVGGGPVWYRDPENGGEVRRVSRSEFRQEGAAGRITGDTVVFDPALVRLGELREGRWERRAADGWHARLLP